MVAKRIDGKAVAKEIRTNLTARVEELKKKTGKVPGLSVIFIGDRKDSATYVALKRKAAKEIGIANLSSNHPEDATQEEIVAKIKELNQNPDVNGILVQLPMPKHLDPRAILGAISPLKDVDALLPDNVGRMFSKTMETRFVPCTPRGIMVLLEKYDVDLVGKRAVVLGRSDIVGLPVAQLLQQADATVTICHSKTKDLESIVKEADVLVCAMGRPESVKAAWLKPGVVVIDVSTSPVNDPTKKSGYKLVGDVEFEEATKVASLITPVPGGVGPMTIAMLMDNTVQGFEASLKEESKKAEKEK
eukprot:TRINITY_DN68008_c0_g1_i1.p1 TRINITY_DN68008_c0_g1~~TRINITY_DN68008_c0_g1_i1.p1  ORF type:complete len:303 (+),score=27.42 TRINITY_DN68008_c0_g1_i1:86-994(+)